MPKNSNTGPTPDPNLLQQESEYGFNSKAEMELILKLGLLEGKKPRGFYKGLALAKTPEEAEMTAEDRERALLLLEGIASTTASARHTKSAPTHHQSPVDAETDKERREREARELEAVDAELHEVSSTDEKFDAARYIELVGKRSEIEKVHAEGRKQRAKAKKSHAREMAPDKAKAARKPTLEQEFHQLVSNMLHLVQSQKFDELENELRLRGNFSNNDKPDIEYMNSDNVRNIVYENYVNKDKLSDSFDGLEEGVIERLTEAVSVAVNHAFSEGGASAVELLIRQIEDLPRQKTPLMRRPHLVKYVGRQSYKSRPNKNVKAADFLTDVYADAIQLGDITFSDIRLLDESLWGAVRGWADHGGHDISDILPLGSDPRGRPKRSSTKSVDAHRPT